MAGYIVAGVPFTDFYGQTDPDYSTIGYLELDIEWGTASNPTRVWAGNGGYTDLYKIGNTGYLSYKRLDGSTLTGTGLRSIATTTGQKLYLYAFSPAQTHQVIIRYSVNPNSGDFINRVLDGVWTTDDILYTNTYENAEGQGIIEIDREWDESPTEDASDPNNLNPNGGAYADLGAWNENDLMRVEDLPDPTDKMPNYHGLVTCYSFHGGELERIANALFFPSFWTSLTNKFSGLSDPLSMILDCYELPISKGTGSTTFKLGGIDVPDPDTGQPFGVSKQQVRYRKVSMGDIVLKEVWGTAKDYTDCSISIFLPYCGVKELDPDIVIQSRLSLYCYIDSWNGDLLYLIHASNYGRENKYFRQDNVVYRFTGNCGKKIPLGRVDTSNQILQAVSGIASIGMGFASGGLSGAAAMAAPVAGNLLNGGFRPAIQTSGGITGNAGRCDYQYAYLIIKRGVPEYPNNWRTEIGAPRNQTFQLSDLQNTGYTLFSEIQLGNMGNATEEEKAELERLLTTEGVIL